MDRITESATFCLDESCSYFRHNADIMKENLITSFDLRETSNIDDFWRPVPVSCKKFYH